VNGSAEFLEDVMHGEWPDYHLQLIEVASELKLYNSIVLLHIIEVNTSVIPVGFVDF
jgi:hypothetical protein